jgi:hypothetical protein
MEEAYNISRTELLDMRAYLRGRISDAEEAEDFARNFSNKLVCVFLEVHGIYHNQNAHDLRGWSRRLVEDLQTRVVGTPK